MKVYVCFSGEYEQRSASAVFTSKEIADQYSDDVEEFELWDRLPLAIEVFSTAGVFKADWPAPSIGDWKVEGQWHVKRDNFSADEYFLQWWAGETVAYWFGKRGPESGICVEVKGSSREAVDARFAELQTEVENGKRP